MDWAGWAVFGFVATVVLTATMVGAQLAGLSRMDIPLLLGAMVVGDPDRARVVGAVVHLANGQIFALGYAAAFALLGRSDWWIGGALGLVHGLAAMTVIVPLLPGLHPRMAGSSSAGRPGAWLEPPGALGLNYGRQTPIVAIVAHVAYGVLLAVLLRPG